MSFRKQPDVVQFYTESRVDEELRDEIENDLELKAMLERGEQDILEGRVVST